ncbi:unnamed protein product [Rotaria magnacalcarata]|uniref:Fibronectin type-III domain-containing protein n=1 Tax=Rotaria magnacalcarata TaxID=392030 RepID=A0A816SPK9_9BILA|nr:unnamed protein product [Rotaria magnacalcarata]CAF2083390.1 unnamed protein product [Rotaria magnacalcarata]CAF4626443.1 unnamed protein product [Rotaria magnacalcarata]
MIYFTVLYTIFIFLPNNFAQIPTNIAVLSTDKDSIRLSWSKPDRLTSIYGYTIKYRSINSGQSWIVRQTNDTKIVLDKLSPITKYEIILQAYTNSSHTDSAGPSTRIEVITDATGNVQ